jgi:hypothetical protein
VAVRNFDAKNFSKSNDFKVGRLFPEMASSGIKSSIDNPPTNDKMDVPELHFATAKLGLSVFSKCGKVPKTNAPTKTERFAQANFVIISRYFHSNGINSASAA